MDTAILYVIGITVAVMVLIIDIMTGGLLLLWENKKLYWGTPGGPSQEPQAYQKIVAKLCQKKKKKIKIFLQVIFKSFIMGK